jgi:NDP-sugar pyrophosphorylase family protein
MDVRALLLIGGSSANSDNDTKAAIAGIPLPHMDVLGLPVEERILRRLRHFGISRATLITDPATADEPYIRRAALDRPDVHRMHVPAADVWRTAEDVFNEYSQDGADLVIALHLGPYVEVDYEEMVQHHLDKHCAVTTAVDSDGKWLDVFVLNASARKDAATLLRGRMGKLRKDCEPFRVTGYINRLRNSSDLRTLAVDGLLEKNAVRPEGREIKPGVWAKDPVRIHPKARIVAPAYIGAHAKIRASALVTRGSAIEHHAEVDCGTVVENSTVLPFTCVGAGLDLMHCVAGFRRLIHLLRNAEVEITDGKLIRMKATSPVSRLAGSTAAIFAFLPKQMYRGMFAPSHRKSAAENTDPQEMATTVESSMMEAQDTGPEASEFPSNMAVARKYGEQ